MAPRGRVEGNYSGNKDENKQFNDASQANNSASLLTYPYKSSAEYAAAVNEWLWKCYHAQCCAITFPFWMTQAALCYSSNSTPDYNRNFPNSFIPNQNFLLGQPRVGGQGQNQANEQNQGVEYQIPSLWKRFVAEVIDFFILLILKVLITYIAVDFFDLINVDKYDLDLLKNNKMDYKKAMEVTSEIIALELIHRFVVCFFEALCLHRGVLGTGGATPGKSIMHLKVVSCYSATTVGDNKVQIYPAGDLGFGWALLRAFIKNFSLAFIFPMCFTMFFFQHNRTAYDIICNSIVVVDCPPLIRRR